MPPATPVDWATLGAAGSAVIVAALNWRTARINARQVGHIQTAVTTSNGHTLAELAEKNAERHVLADRAEDHERSRAGLPPLPRVVEDPPTSTQPPEEAT
jgi:hypothetical protein